MRPPAAFSADELAVFDPGTKLRLGRLPLLLLHGAEDTLIAPSEAVAAHAAAASGEKELVLVSGHGHNDIGYAPSYWSALRAFLDRVLHVVG